MSFIHLIRLTRPLNLLIIAATMYSLRCCIIFPLLQKNSPGYDLRFSEFNFFLSVVVMILLAAAGNIINDYFDQKVDRINRPESVIVGKTVKRRVAMILHQALNILAILISIYLAWVSKQWLAIIIPVIIATILWWYSPVLKKTAFWGNLAVAFCVASVPVWTGLFEINALKNEYTDMLPQPVTTFREMWLWLLAYSGFAFLLTLAREAQKDLEDIAGDRDEGYSTLPIVWGEKNTRFYAALILSIAFIGVIGLTMWFSRGRFIAGLASLFVAAPILLSAIYTMRSFEKRSYKMASNITKAAMAAGILFTFVIRWWLLKQ